MTNVKSTELLSISYNDKQVNSILKPNKLRKERLTSELTHYATKYLQDNFNLTLNIPITVSGRLTTAIGCLEMERVVDYVPLQIKINQTQLMLSDHFNRMDIIENVLNHELIHYALYLRGMEYTDGSKDFESTLRDLQVPSSEATGEKKALGTKIVNFSITDVYKVDVLGHDNGTVEVVHSGINKSHKYQVAQGALVERTGFKVKLMEKL